MDRDAGGWTIIGEADRFGVRDWCERHGDLRGQLRKIAFSVGAEIPGFRSRESKKLSHDARHAVDIVLQLDCTCDREVEQAVYRLSFPQFLPKDRRAA